MAVADFGPINVGPIPDISTGQPQRDIDLPEGTYIIEGSYVWTRPELQPDPADTVRLGVTRVFLGGVPLLDGGGYNFAPTPPLTGTFLANVPQAHTSVTVFEVPAGGAGSSRMPSWWGTASCCSATT